jgi:hypothetical protein
MSIVSFLFFPLFFLRERGSRPDVDPLELPERKQNTVTIIRTMLTSKEAPLHCKLSVYRNSSPEDKWQNGKTKRAAADGKLTIMFSLFSLSNVSLNRLFDFSYSATAWSSQTFRFSSCASISITNKRVSYRPYRLNCCIISSAASWTLRKLTLFSRSLFFSLCRFAATRFISLLLPLTTTRPSLPTSSSSSSPVPEPVCPVSVEQNGGGGCNPRSLKENGCGGSGM